MNDVREHVATTARHSLLLQMRGPAPRRQLGQCALQARRGRLKEGPSSSEATRSPRALKRAKAAGRHPNRPENLQHLQPRVDPKFWHRWLPLGLIFGHVCLTPVTGPFP